jgi:hypothetical protein
MLDLAILPNIDGFEFIVILKNGNRKKTKVFKDENGLHRFVEFNDSIGWIRI